MSLFCSFSSQGCGVGGKPRIRRTMTDAKLEKYVIASVVASTVIFFGLLIASVAVGKATSDLDARNGLIVNVTGYQWWWRVEYVHPEPAQYITTANEIHIPVGRPVTFVLTSSDVIHSFWAPNLHGKRDLHSESKELPRPARRQTRCVPGSVC